MSPSRLPKRKDPGEVAAQAAAVRKTQLKNRWRFRYGYVVTKNFRYLKWRNPELYFCLFWGWGHKPYPYSLHRCTVPPFWVSEMLGDVVLVLMFTLSISLLNQKLSPKKEKHVVDSIETMKNKEFL